MSCRPVAASQMRTVLSSDAVTTRRPSGEKAKRDDKAKWPCRSWVCGPAAGIPDAGGLVV